MSPTASWRSSAALQRRGVDRDRPGNYNNFRTATWSGLSRPSGSCRAQDDGVPDRLRPAGPWQSLYAAPLCPPERLLVGQRQDQPAAVLPGRLRPEPARVSADPVVRRRAVRDGRAARRAQRPQTNPFIKDELLRRLHRDMGQVACMGTFANLFINGEYKGFYNPTEHVKEESCQQWFDSDKSWDVMTMNGIRDGDSQSCDAMINYARTHNLADPTYYAELCKKLDVVCFIDYLIIRLWPNDWDWPQNNWSAACERSETGKWKFFVWDAEGTFESGQLYARQVPRAEYQGNGNGYLYRALKANTDFRLLFADRVYKHFFNGGALTAGERQPAVLRDARPSCMSVIPEHEHRTSSTVDPEPAERLPERLHPRGHVHLRRPELHGQRDAAVRRDIGLPGDRLSMISARRGGDQSLYPRRERSGPVRFAAVAARDHAGRRRTRRNASWSRRGRMASDWRRSARSTIRPGWHRRAPPAASVSSGAPASNPTSAPTWAARCTTSTARATSAFPSEFDGDKDALENHDPQMQYDDGFIAYLNGTEVARRNFVGDPAWNSDGHCRPRQRGGGGSSSHRSLRAYRQTAAGRQHPGHPGSERRGEQAPIS